MKTKNVNEPNWRTLQSKVKFPKELAVFEDMIHNLQWGWYSDATDLFYDIDIKLWKKYYNPIIMFQKISLKRIEEIKKDKILVKRIKEVVAKFEEYISRDFDSNESSIAYFSMEYGSSYILKIQSGGLGILAGDFLKETSDSRVDMIGVGLLLVSACFFRSSVWLWYTPIEALASTFKLNCAYSCRFICDPSQDKDRSFFPDSFLGRIKSLILLSQTHFLFNQNLHLNEL